MAQGCHTTTAPAAANTTKKPRRASGNRHYLAVTKEYLTKGIAEEDRAQQAAVSIIAPLALSAARLMCSRLESPSNSFARYPFVRAFPEPLIPLSRRQFSSNRRKTPVLSWISLLLVSGTLNLKVGGSLRYNKSLPMLWPALRLARGGLATDVFLTFLLLAHRLCILLHYPIQSRSARTFLRDYGRSLSCRARSKALSQSD
jgi:hypothetical protein